MDSPPLFPATRASERRLAPQHCSCASCLCLVPVPIEVTVTVGPRPALRLGSPAWLDSLEWFDWLDWPDLPGPRLSPRLGCCILGIPPPRQSLNPFLTPSEFRLRPRPRPPRSPPFGLERRIYEESIQGIHKSQDLCRQDQTQATV